MNLITKKSIIITLLGWSTAQYATPEHIITFFVKKFPYFKEKKYNPNFSQALKQPGYITHKIIRKYTDSIEGVMFLYAGNIAISNRWGQVTFPCLQQSRTMNILVTPTIEPSYILAPSTIQSWNFQNSSNQKAWYTVTSEYDHETSLYYHMTQKTDGPSDNSIPLNTIILISNPDDVYIPQGATIIQQSSSLVLPDIFIKRTFCFVYNSLYNLAIKQYFDQTTQTIKQDGQTVIHIEQ